MSVPIDARRIRIAAAIAGCLALESAEPCLAGNYDNVLNCLDSGAGSLRATIASAGSGDTIVLNPVTMNCSSVTLTGGEIVVGQQTLTVKYNGNNANRFTISGGSASRVFKHTYSNGSLTLQRLNIVDGLVDDTASPSIEPIGGCVYSDGNVTLTHSTLSGCQVKDTRGFGAIGGGIFAFKSVTLSYSTVSNNTAKSTITGANGGGIYVAGPVTISFSSITGNSAIASGTGKSVGGGMCMYAPSATTSIISGSTIDGNRAGIGAGLCFAGPGTTTIDDSTISGNQASVYGGAFAFLVQANVSFNLNNSTVAFNSNPPDQGAITFYGEFGSAGFSNSIIADNAGDSIVVFNGSRIITGSNNIVVGATQAATLPGDTVPDDPLLLPLDNNGGPTLTHAFRYGSPAFGAGTNPYGFPDDQRGPGFARTVDGATDIGAFEQQVRDRIFASGFD